MEVPVFRSSEPRRRGGNAIEFGLTLPVFFMVMMGVVDYGWWFGARAGLANAVSLGCREGSMVDSKAGRDPVVVATDDITARAAPWCATPGAGCTYNAEMKWDVPDRAISCRASMPFNPLVGLVPTPSTVDAESRFRMEWQRQPPAPVP